MYIYKHNGRVSTHKMVNVVDIEIKTFELLFFMLKSDIRTYEIAVQKKWTAGIFTYAKKINEVFSKISEIKKVIMESIKHHEEGVEAIKSGADTLPSTFKKRFNAESNSVMALLKSLKASSFELEMYRSGFREFMDDTGFDEDVIKKVDDKGELRHYRIKSDGSNEEIFPYKENGTRN